MRLYNLIPLSLCGWSVSARVVLELLEKLFFSIINLKITALIRTNQSHPLEKRQGVGVGGVGHLNYSLNNISSPALPLPRQPHRHLQGAY